MDVKLLLARGALWNGKFETLLLNRRHYRHYGQFPDTVGPEDDFNSTRVMHDVLEFEHPDFVIFTGDLVTGDKMYPNVSEYIHMLLKPVVEKGYK